MSANKGVYQLEEPNISIYSYRELRDGEEFWRKSV